MMPDKKWIGLTLKCVFIELVGVPIALSRLFEPYVF